MEDLSVQGMQELDLTLWFKIQQVSIRCDISHVCITEKEGLISRLGFSALIFVTKYISFFRRIRARRSEMSFVQNFELHLNFERVLSCTSVFQQSLWFTIWLLTSSYVEEKWNDTCVVEASVFSIVITCWERDLWPSLVEPFTSEAGMDIPGHF